MSEVNEQTGELDIPETSPLASVPGFSRPIDPYEDMDMVVEGSEEASALNQEPEELVGKTKEDLFNQLKALQSELNTTKQGLDPVKALGTSLQEALRMRQEPMQQVQNTAPREDPEARQRRLNDLFMQDPVRAAEEIQREQLRPIVDMMLSSTTALSKDLALAEPSQKQVYDKWQDEVEREVQMMSPVEKAQNPRVYQTAIQRVRSRHTDDLVQDLVAQAVQAKLKELGLDGSQPQKQAPFTPNRTGNPPPRGRNTVVVPNDVWQRVTQEANRIGLDPKFYYQHLKEKGQIK